MTAVERDPDGQVHDWVFTFGEGQAHRGRYVVIAGTFDDARAEAYRRFGRLWSRQYASREDAGVARFGLVPLESA
jgi:hypothetical protein